MTDLNEYPAGIRDLLGWAKFHLQELDKLELEFRAWEGGSGGSAARAAQAEAPPSPSVETLLQLGTSSRAEQARLRWEAMARTACPPQTGGDEKANL